MNHAVRGAVCAPSIAIALLCLAACEGHEQTSGTEAQAQGQASTTIQVDNPQLRAQKEAAGIAPCPTSKGERAASGGLPEVVLPCLGGGREVNLAHLTGSPTIINFWAQYCGPCRSESPVIESVYRHVGNKVQVLGVDWQDPQPDKAIAFADELGITYPQVADPAGVTRAPLAMVGLPITVFVDASGKITHVETGPIDSTADLEALIAEHLGVDVTDAGS